MNEPLTPPDCDLRDFAFVPIDITRLFGSEFHAASDDATWRAGFTLWLKSYHQTPAASIPDDDVALARLAEFGRDVKGWRKVKAGALRGWRKCSDGRMYHPVVAEKALEAWVSKILQRKATAAATAKRLGCPFDPAPFDRQIADALDRLQRLSPGSRILAKRLRRVGQMPSGLPGDAPDGDPHGDPGGAPPGEPDGGPPDAQNTVQVDVQGTGTGTETGNIKETRDGDAVGSSLADAPPAEPDRQPHQPSAFDRFWAAWPNKVGRPAALKAFAKHAERIDDILAGVARYIATKPADRPWLNPATFLNQERWADQPAPVSQSRSSAAPAPAPDLPGDPMLDFPGGCRRSTSFVRRAVANHVANRRSWPLDLGPPPGAPGCLVPDHLLGVGSAAA